METFVSDRIEIRGLSRSQREELKAEFSIPNPKFAAAVKYGSIHQSYITIPKTIELAEIKNDSIFIPRGADFELLRKYGHVEIRDQMNYTKFDNDLPPLLIQYTKEQRAVIDNVTEDAERQKHFLMGDRHNGTERPFGTWLNVMEVASGKTIAAAGIVRQLQRKALIFVHTQLIMNAWISDLCKMYGEDYRSEIGIIQGPKALIGPHYTIAMAQTWFRRQKMWPEWNKHWGVLVFDEVHLASCRSFQECANFSPAAYRIGITGTPKRKDGLHRVVYRIFGTPFYTMKSTGLETENSLPVDKVVVVQTGATLNLDREDFTKTDKYGRLIKQEDVDDNRDYNIILESLISNRERTNLIVEKAINVLNADPNNVILITTHRKSHAERIKFLIKKRSGKEVALLISDEGRDSIRENEEKLKRREIRIAVATIQLIKTGASIPSLNRLFIATPIGSRQDLEQLIGRIRRKCPGKTNARVYHFLDSQIKLCHRHFYKHAHPFYRDVLRIPGFVNKYIG